jgi:hypothetical protein
MHGRHHASAAAVDAQPEMGWQHARERDHRGAGRRDRARHPGPEVGGTGQRVCGERQEHKLRQPGRAAHALDDDRFGDRGRGAGRRVDDESGARARERGQAIGERVGDRVQGGAAVEMERQAGGMRHDAEHHLGAGGLSREMEAGPTPVGAELRGKRRDRGRVEPGQDEAAQVTGAGRASTCRAAGLARRR